MMYIKKVILCAVTVSMTVAMFLANANIALAEATRLPVIHQIGSAPVRFEGDLDDSSLKKHFTNGFYKAARDARRFRVLDDDLVAGLWSTKKGRAELVSQFELHAFASFNVVTRGDRKTSESGFGCMAHGK